MTRDLTPTWSAMALLFTRLAESGERKACRTMAPEVHRMGAMCDALNRIFTVAHAHAHQPDDVALAAIREAIEAAHVAGKAGE